ncbi:MAG: hypothetical protein Q8P56_01330 [Candidatus Uhrbacteria bacterium]|nr:hypothetical protein [Candidatus Uhrbacteria bacterium]
MVVPSLTRLRRPFRAEAQLWRFVRFTGVMLDPALVQNAYEKILKAWSYGFDSEALLHMEDVRNSTGVVFSAEGHEALVADMYEKIFDRMISPDRHLGNVTGYLTQCDALQECTGIPVSARVFSKSFKEPLGGSLGGGALWEIMNHFKNLPLLWDEIDPQADSEIYESTRKMPSNDLQKKMWDILCRGGGGLIVHSSGEHAREQYASMPPYIYAVWLKMFNSGMPVITDWFLKTVNDAFTKIRLDIGKKKPGSRAILDRLDYGIITSYHVRPDMREFLRDLNVLTQRGVSPEELADLFYSYAVTSQLFESMKDGDPGAVEHVRQRYARSEQFSGTVAEYTGQFERQAAELFGATIGIADVSYDDLARVREKWGSLEVIFTLAGKYAKEYEDGMPLFRALLAAELEDRWHADRYDKSDPIIARQLEGLTPEEDEGWIENSPQQKLSDVALGAIDISKIAEVVRNHVITSLDGNHICPNEHRGDGDHLFEETVDFFLRGIVHEHRIPHNISYIKDRIRSRIYEKRTLPEVLEKIDITTRPDEDGFDHDFFVALEREISALSTVDASTLTRQQKTLLGHLNGARDWLKARSTSERTRMDNDLLGIRRELSLDDLEEIQKALETAELVVRLAQISKEEITSSILPPLIEGGRPDSLTTSLDKLIRIFEMRKSPFVQDLANIQAELSQRFAVGAVEHLDLTIRESDDLKESLESGKYPRGASSCQNYESDVYYTKCLLARAGDADKKNVIIEKNDRTIVVENELKLVYIDNKIPAIFVEPTNYSGIRQRYDVSPDVDRYAKAKARRMSNRVKVLRGADKGEDGAILVTVRPSRNHYQYEDGKHGGPGHGGLGIKEGEYTMWAVEVV